MQILLILHCLSKGLDLQVADKCNIIESVAPPVTKVKRKSRFAGLLGGDFEVNEKKPLIKISNLQKALELHMENLCLWHSVGSFPLCKSDADITNPAYCRIFVDTIRPTCIYLT